MRTFTCVGVPVMTVNYIKPTLIQQGMLETHSSSKIFGCLFVAIYFCIGTSFCVPELASCALDLRFPFVANPFVKTFHISLTWSRDIFLGHSLCLVPSIAWPSQQRLYSLRSMCLYLINLSHLWHSSYLFSGHIFRSWQCKVPPQHYLHGVI